MKKDSKPAITPYKNGFQCSGTETLIDGTKERFQASASTKESAYKKFTKKTNRSLLI